MADSQFLIILYDKLWTNIVHKESRVWTFLTVYGAAIGIVIGVGLAGNLQPITTLVILILTYWAGELIIDTDWWSIRNKAMIIQIEKNFPAQTDSVIPEYYQDAKFSSSSLYNVSLLIFTAVGFAVLMDNFWRMSISDQFHGALAWFSTLLYFIWSLILVRWAHVRAIRTDLYRSH